MALPVGIGLSRRVVRARECLWAGPNANAAPTEIGECRGIERTFDATVAIVARLHTHRSPSPRSPPARARVLIRDRDDERDIHRVSINEMTADFHRARLWPVRRAVVCGWVPSRGSRTGRCPPRDLWQYCRYCLAVLGSSGNSGKCRADFEEEVRIIVIAVRPALQHLDLVIYPLDETGVELMARVVDDVVGR